jgi:tetratricopeptide (TPR) repeat protein
LLQDAFNTVKGSPDADLRRKVTCDLALALANLGRVADARRMLISVIDDPQSTAQQAAECLSYRSTVAGLENDAAASVSYGKMALQRLRTAANPSTAMEAGILAAIGDGERLAGHSAVAEDYFRQSLEQYARAGRERGPDATVIRNNLAIVYDATGNPKRALELYDGILRTAAQTNPMALPPVVIVGNRARALELIGRYGESRDAYNRCIELSRKGGLANMRLHCLTGLAWAACELGDLKLADRSMREASELAKTIVPGSELITLKVARGRIALANNQLAEARANLDAAITDGNTVFYQMTALVPRAELNLKEGRLAEAESDARRALSLAQKAQGGVGYSNRTGMSWLVLGRVLAKKGDAAGSQQALRSALEHLSNTVDADHPMLLLARQLAPDWPPG